jgi:hypothetical protein
MMGSRAQSNHVGRREQSAHVELEWVVAQLADEVEHWKSRSEALEGVFEELEAELNREREIGDAWRQALVDEANELARLGVGPSKERVAAPLASLVIAVVVALVLWALVGLLVYAGLRIVAG